MKMQILNRLDFHTLFPRYLQPNRFGGVTEQVHTIGCALLPFVHAHPPARPLIKLITLISLTGELRLEYTHFQNLYTQFVNGRLSFSDFLEQTSNLPSFMKALQICFPFPFLIAELKPAVVNFVSNPNGETLFSLMQNLTYFFAITAQEWAPLQ